MREADGKSPGPREVEARLSGVWRANGAKTVADLRVSISPACRDSAGRWLRLVLPRRPSFTNHSDNDAP